MRRQTSKEALGTVKHEGTAFRYEVLKFTNTLQINEKASATNVLITEINNSRGMDNCVIDTIQYNAMQPMQCNSN